MTPNELAAAGRALYGERWQTPLAMDLQVADRTMRRWLADARAIPDSVERELREILVERVKEISKLIGYSVNPSDRSVVHYPTNATFRYDVSGNVTMIHPGVAPWGDVSRLTEGARETVHQERERDKDTAKRFIAESAWWLTHSSGRPVRAPGHADRVYMSPQHGWAIEFGANAFLVGKAIERCRKYLERCKKEAEAGKAVLRSQIEAELKKIISGCVANSGDKEYNGYYRIRDDDTLVFGAQGIGVDDCASFMMGEANLRWDGDALATPSPATPALPRQLTIPQLPFNPALLTTIDTLEVSIRTANCLKNDSIVYIGDLVKKTEAEMLRTSNFGRKSLNEIKEVLAEKGLNLGMEVSGWPPDNIELIAEGYAARVASQK